jgi:hypothetical protein
MSKKKSKGSLKKEASQKENPEVKDEVVEAKTKPEQPFVSEPGDVEDSVESSDFRGLSKKEKDALKKKARGIAEKEAKQKIEDDFLKAEVAKAKREEEAKYGLADEEEEIVRYTVNLSSASDRHLINGKAYLHGHTYEVPKSLADCMRDTEYRGHEQERLRKGQKTNEFGLRHRDGIKSAGGVANA